MRFVSLFAASLLAFSVAACGGSKKEATTDTTAPTAETKSLYDRLGGVDAITVVIDKFLGHVVADARINQYFATVTPEQVAALRQHLIDQVCQATGGPCEYKGRSMKETHTGMGLTNADFDALVEDLVKALDEAGVQQTEKDELLGALGGMRGDIVEKP